ncbi:hypothetical protein EVAR_4778_1 [Eumeta japonica]|uniref:Uncharacterized protein n=1 Tax=Eumeta variegata TaxID=151549 RepID=A0A4C1T1P1_EUMVA|nr:hypothetical protein EVAR_4778_1 [Eumeta japonica]
MPGAGAARDGGTRRANRNKLTARRNQRSGLSHLNKSRGERYRNNGFLRESPAKNYVPLGKSVTRGGAPGGPPAPSRPCPPLHQSSWAEALFRLRWGLRKWPGFV